MNQQERQARQYLERQIQNASPAQQIVMLYDGVIKFMLRAQKAIDEGDIQSRCNANRRAMEIVAYLLEILDMEKGGEMSVRLGKIYAYVFKQLLDVDVKNSRAATEEVLIHIRTLRQAWSQLAEQGTQPAPQQEGSSAPKAARPSTPTGEEVSDQPGNIKRTAVVA